MCPRFPLGLVLAAALSTLTGGCSGPRAAPPAPEREPPLARPGSRLLIGLRRLGGRPVLEVKALSGLRITNRATGKKLASVAAGRVVTVSTDPSNAGVRARAKGVNVRARDLVLSGGLLGVGSRRYPGKLHLAMGGAGLEIVNELEIEQYLEGVLPGELPPGFGLEAQKAQAVAARTYALVQRGKHGEFDLCDRPHCQMYVGRTRAAGRAIEAVRATRRQCLWHEGKLAYAFYSADCGGRSARVEDVPLVDKPAEPLSYLASVRDAPPGGPDYCAASPYHAWRRRFTREELQDRLNREPETHVGELRNLQVLDQDPSGRIRTVALWGSESTAQEPPALFRRPAEAKRVTGWAFRRAVGPLALKSTLLRIDRPLPDVFRFQGSGFGHGLGLCQIGAAGMAERGRTFRQILAHYYPGTRLAPLP